MKLPKTARDFALKNELNLGRREVGDEIIFFVRDPKTLAEVARTACKRPTAGMVVAMMRRHLAAETARLAGRLRKVLAKGDK